MSPAGLPAPGDPVLPVTRVDPAEDEVAGIAGGSPGSPSVRPTVIAEIDVLARAVSCPVTIGLPVLNGARTLRRAIDSLLAQTFHNFRLVISDNASTDDTAEIAAEYAARDRRVSVVRQPHTLSAIDNFSGLVAAATTPFFMFATDDDQWQPRFVEATLTAMIADPGASLSVPKVAFLDGDGQTLCLDTRPLIGTPEQRINAYLTGISDHARFYGLHRTSALAAGFAAVKPMPAFDWLALVPSVIAGRHLEVPELLLLRDRTPIANYRQWILRLEPTILGRILPHLRLTLAVYAMLPPELRRSVVPELAHLCVASAANSPYAWVRDVYATLLRVRRLIRGRRAGSSP